MTFTEQWQELLQMHVGRTIVAIAIVSPASCPGEDFIRWTFDDGSYTDWSTRMYVAPDFLQKREPFGGQPHG